MENPIEIKKNAPYDFKQTLLVILTVDLLKPMQFHNK